MPTSRVTRAIPAMSRVDSIFHTASIALCVSLMRVLLCHLHQIVFPDALDQLPLRIDARAARLLRDDDLQRLPAALHTVSREIDRRVVAISKHSHLDHIVFGAMGFRWNDE